MAHRLGIPEAARARDPASHLDPSRRATPSSASAMSDAPLIVPPPPLEGAAVTVRLTELDGEKAELFEHISV